jgi:predicted alpha/beta superfamily hydrolase
MKATAGLLFALILTNVPAHAASDGKQIVVPRTEYYDIASSISGRTYRVMVATPFKGDPSVEYPVVYILDGNDYFRTSVDVLTRLNFNNISAPAILVGIGYPTDDPEVTRRLRRADLTPSVESNAPPGAGPSGEGDAFLQAIEKEIKPFVAGRYKVDKTKQIIFGHSLGGLIALRTLFRNPSVFSTYVLSSPSIWWNDKDVLADEEAFSKRARAGELHLNVLVTSAGDEQYRGDDPKLLAAARTRMVDNASELAQRFASLDPDSIEVVRTIFAGENHTSVSAAALTRALRFALPLN